MKQDRIYKLRQMPTESAPKDAPILVAGGIAMLKSDGVWYSGMLDPTFSRALEWVPEWWSNVPHQNDPLIESN